MPLLTDVASHRIQYLVDATKRLPRAGNISIPGNSSAKYTFSIGSDDGSMLYIDGALVINNTGATLYSLTSRVESIVFTMAHHDCHPKQAFGLREEELSHVCSRRSWHCQ